MYSENYLSTELGMQLYKEWMPAWDKAELQELSGNKVVEVPLMFKKIRASVSDDLLQAYKETNDPKYLIADIKLIIEKDSATGEMRVLIREITPTLEYLQANDFNPICLSRMDELSGSVKYFTPDWQLIYIYTYENGEITKGLTVNPRTRSGEEYCFTFTELVITDWYLNSPDGPYITTTYGYTFITYCISAEDSGIDDSGSGGGGSGGSGPGSGPENNQTTQSQQYNQNARNILDVLKKNNLQTNLTLILSSQISTVIEDLSKSKISQYAYIDVNKTNNAIFNPDTKYAFHIADNLSPTTLKLILAHEYMHLYIFEQMMSAGSFQELSMTNLELSSYINMYRSLSPDDFINAAHHEYMGNNIEIVEQLLRNTFPGESNDFYRYGRWTGGAFNSDAFRDLSKTERIAIFKYLKKNGLR